jgi:hypothetical protein
LSVIPEFARTNSQEQLVTSGVLRQPLSACTVLAGPLRKAACHRGIGGDGAEISELGEEVREASL